AKSAEFQSVLELAKKVTKSSGEPVDLEEGIVEGARAFRIAKGKTALEILEMIRPKAAALGAFGFLSENLVKDGVTHLVLVPDPDYRKVIVAFETPVGQSVDSYDLNKWLKKLEQKEPFVITHIAPDLLRARFTSKLKDAKWVAKQVHEI